MHRRRLLILALIVTGAALAALLIQGLVVEGIVLPLLRALAYLRLSMMTVPQETYWLVFSAGAGLAVGAALILRLSFTFRSRYTIQKPEGPVEKTAHIIASGRSGVYSCWLLANRLAGIARTILIDREGAGALEGKRDLEGRDWNPPPEVGEYLNAGLNRSFIDVYPARKRSFFGSRQPTVFDLPPEIVVDYLESQLEKKV